MAIPLSIQDTPRKRMNYMKQIDRIECAESDVGVQEVVEKRDKAPKRVAPGPSPFVEIMRDESLGLWFSRLRTYRERSGKSRKAVALAMANVIVNNLGPEDFNTFSVRAKDVDTAFYAVENFIKKLEMGKIRPTINDLCCYVVNVDSRTKASDVNSINESGIIPIKDVSGVLTSEPYRVLEAFREHMRASPSVLAAKIGVSSSLFRKFENGTHKPTEGELMKWMKALAFKDVDSMIEDFRKINGICKEPTKEEEVVKKEEVAFVPVPAPVSELTAINRAAYVQQAMKLINNKRLSDAEVVKLCDFLSKKVVEILLED